MFTGIIVGMGRVEKVLAQEGRDVTARINVANALLLENLKIGSSIACSGVCLTLTAKQRECITVSISHETLSVTNLKHWNSGTMVNLEPALKPEDALDGHIVQGHIDGVGIIQSIKKIADSHVIEISCSTDISKYIAYKGSVALDGVSMTVNSVNNTAFQVNVIPHTFSKTTFQYRKVGHEINIEVDIIARYLERLFHGTQQN